MPSGVYPRKARHGRIARGVVRSSGLVTCALTIPPDLFEEIKTLAIKEDTTFTHQVCLLLEWGLESTKGIK